MTREQNFRTSFIPQLETFASWENIPRMSVSKIPLSLFPSFSLDIGKTKYTAFDLTGKATKGEQEFTVTVYYTFNLRESEYAYTGHSNIVDLLEQFINVPVYIPPVVLPGETYSIDRCKLIEAKSPSIEPGYALHRKRCREVFIYVDVMTDVLTYCFFLR